MIYFLVYFIIGLIIGCYIWHRLCKEQTPEEKEAENPSILIALPCMIFLWPIATVSYIHYKADKNYL